jgi:hypothetical protein
MLDAEEHCMYMEKSTYLSSWWYAAITLLHMSCKSYEIQTYAGHNSVVVSVLHSYDGKMLISYECLHFHVVLAIVQRVLSCSIDHTPAMGINCLDVGVGLCRCWHCKSSLATKSRHPVVAVHGLCCCL